MVSVVVCLCSGKMFRWTLPHEQSCYKLFLFDWATIGAAKMFALQRQMNRARGACAIRRSKRTEHCDYVVTRVRIYRFLRAASIKTIVGALLSLARC